VKILGEILLKINNRSWCFWFINFWKWSRSFRINYNLKKKKCVFFIAINKKWTYYIRRDIKLRDLELHKLMLNYEKRTQKLILIMAVIGASTSWRKKYKHKKLVNQYFSSWP